MADELLIAVFVDYENLAIGVRDMKTELKLDLVLKRLLEKGRIVYKRAYGDWNAYAGAVRELHALGISMMEMPRGRHSGKNSADIHMVVDALDLCYAKEHIDAFALLSGDSDFSPLVSKLKENDKRVIGCGVKNSTSDLLIASCDEFIYYDDLVRASQKATPVKKKAATTGAKPTKKEEALERLAEIVTLAVARLRHRVGLDGEADDPARVPGLQRGLLRLPVLRRAARRRPRPERDRRSTTTSGAATTW